MKKIDLSVSRILDDPTFRFSSHDPSKTNRIAESIQRSGMRAPLVAVEREDGFQILAGFSRLDAARETSVASVPAEVLDTGENIVPIFYAALLEHRSLSDFRLFEKTRILNILDGLPPDPKTRKEILRLLELPDKTDLHGQMRRLLTLRPTLRSYLEQYDVSLKQACAFFEFSSSDQEWLAGLGNGLQIRPVELIEIATPLQEISKREDLSIQTVLQETDIPVLLDSEESKARKVSEIRRRISERRFPQWTEIQSQIEKTQKALRLPANIRLRWDRTLESPGVQLKVSLNKTEDVQKLVRALQDGIDSKQFQKLFELAG